MNKNNILYMGQTCERPTEFIKEIVSGKGPRDSLPKNIDDNGEAPQDALKKEEEEKYEKYTSGPEDNLSGPKVQLKSEVQLKEEGGKVFNFSNGFGVETGEYHFEGEGINIIEREPELRQRVDINVQQEIIDPISRERGSGKKVYQLQNKYVAMSEYRSSETANYGNNISLKYSRPNDEYSNYIFDQINLIRQNPSSFINVIQSAKSKISKNQKGMLIYKDKIKVALADGVDAFNEAIDFLRNTPPMKPLIFVPELVVDLPFTRGDAESKSYLRNKVKEMIDGGSPVRAFWRDIIKDPKVSFLLMIVDDTGNKRGSKRRDILDPDMRYIGLNSGVIDNYFVSYMTFCS